ncbi:MAG: hypothetical protein RIR77_2082 [Planctomycetota bacterium]|jgi:hypothetical protein
MYKLNTGIAWVALLMTSGAVMAAPPAPRGIADLRGWQPNGQTTETKTKDDQGIPPKTETTPDILRVCNFSGFAQYCTVNRAYAGGTSSCGVAQTNIGIAFTGAEVLNTYNGSGQPDAGIVYAPNGEILVGIENFSTNQISFYYTSTVAMTVRAFATADGTGTPTATFNLTANSSNNPYYVWSVFTQALDVSTRSVRIAGSASKWGIDRLAMQDASPAPVITSVSPNFGSQFGGTPITIVGSNLTGTTSVTIGGVAATNIAVTSATQVTAVTPFSATSGAKAVAVTTPSGTFSAPDLFTYTAAVPVLALTTNGSPCSLVGASVNVSATLSGVVTPILAGQINLTWTPSKMSLVSITSGDAPFNQVHVINQTAGTALILVSLTQGSAPVTVNSAVVARLNFTTASASCSGAGTAIEFFPSGTLPTEFANGTGGTVLPTLIASSVFSVDDGVPVLVNVPANVAVQAEAGLGSFARVTLTPPTVTDTCTPGLVVTGTRSDGAAMNALYPVGTTTVTWRATDPCGNTASAPTTVTVAPFNTITFAVSYTNSSGYAASSARTLTLNIHGAQGYTLKPSQAVTLLYGASTFSLTNMAIDNYDCVAVEEQGRSLRKVASITDAGLIWSSTSALVAGDLIDDEVIDVLDWGAFIANNPFADLNGDGVINSVDGNIILANYGLLGETGCGNSFTGPQGPVDEISVADLVRRGLSGLVVADLNKDGWLNATDVEMWLKSH